MSNESNGSNGVEAPSDLETKIIRQMEFYFGDANLSKDKFLKSQIKQDDGWVKLETLLTFNRLKQLSEDAGVIVEAVKKSKSGLIEVNEDKSKVRRSTSKPLPENTKEYAMSLKGRSVYAKGFSPEAGLDQIQTFLEEYGRVDHIQMRRNEEKSFKGSVFAMFATEEGAKAFIDAKDVKYGESEVSKMYKDDYFKMKNEEKKTKKEEQLKKQEEEEKEAEEKKFEDRITKGAILLIKGVKGRVRVGELKDEWNQKIQVAWIDQKETELRVRFTDEDGAKKGMEVLKDKDGKLKVNDEEVEAEVLQGEAELDHWRDVFKAQRERSKGGRGRGGRGGFRGGRGGRGGKRGRGGRRDDDNEDESPAKRPRTEAPAGDGGD